MEAKSTENCPMSHCWAITLGLSPQLHVAPPHYTSHNSGRLAAGHCRNFLPGCASWPSAEGSGWCSGHSQPPGASAVLAAPGTASAGPSCGGRGLEGSASLALLARQQGREGQRQMVPGAQCCQGKAGTHLRFSSSLCTDLPMPGRTGEGASATTHTLSPRDLKSTRDVGPKLA